MDYGLSEGVTARILLSETWAPIVVGGGCWEEGMLPEDIFAAAGTILKDKEIRKLRALPEYQIRADVLPAAFHTNWPALFESLGPAGRAALCERVKNARKK